MLSFSFLFEATHTTFGASQGESNDINFFISSVDGKRV